MNWGKSWRVVSAITYKDLLDAIKNLYILFALLLPIGMSLLFGLIMPDQNADSRIALAVYAPTYSEVVAGLRQNEALRVTETGSAQEALERAEEDAAALILPEGFDAAVRAGQQPEMTIYINRGHPQGEALFLRQVIEEQVWALVGGPTFPARITRNDVNVPARGESFEEFSVSQYLLILLLVMSLAMTGTFVVPTLLVEEKEKHTLVTLLVSPATTGEVVAGKALTGLIYSLLISGILLLINRSAVTHWGMTVVTVTAGMLFMVMIGLLMGGLFQTMNQVNSWSSIVMLLLMVPSFSFPGMPEAVTRVYRLIPSDAFVRALRVALSGEGVQFAWWGNLLLLGAMTLLLFGGVVWALRREMK